MTDKSPSPHRTRQTTAPGEQGILLAYIKKYFSYPERSHGRTDVVYEVLNLLVQKDQRWNARLVRLWFNNNRKNYCELPPQINPTSNHETAQTYEKHNFHNVSNISNSNLKIVERSENDFADIMMLRAKKQMLMPNDFLQQPYSPHYYLNPPPLKEHSPTKNPRPSPTVLKRKVIQIPPKI